jgi:Leucine-rich repeat (LRR) protein/GTPase SAR1 family protein
MANIPELIRNRLKEAKEKKLEELDLSFTGLEDETAPAVLVLASKLDHLTSLNLSQNHLTSVPTQVTQLHNLTTLDVSGNSLGSLSEWVRKLGSLTTLNVSGNSLKRLPDGIRELRNLTTLDVGGNALGSLPEGMRELYNLTMLAVRGNHLGNLPKWLRELRNLTSLDVSYNPLKGLPEGLRELRNLTVLDVSGTRLGSLPEWLGELSSLTTLNVSGTRLGSLPEWLRKLSSLTTLNVSSNSLGSLPEWLRELSSLTALDINFNNLKSLPEWLRELSSLTTLVVSGNSLKGLPEWLRELSSLTTLNVSICDLGRLPAGLRELRNLTTLNVSSNSLEILPEWLRELRNLTTIKAWSNNLRSLPRSLGELRNLTSLDVSYNPLKRLPEGLRELRNLTVLDVSGTGLRSLPEWLGELSSLTTLNVNGNGLKRLPEGLRELRHLTMLQAGNNKFSAFPSVLYDLTSLRNLTLGNYGHTDERNEIKEIAPEILRLEGLKNLDLRDNPLVTPPLDIADKGIVEIKRYFRQLATEGLDHLYEAKLLIVGEGGAGKTSLAKTIVNPEYQLREDEDSTKGIEVIQWHFNVADDKPFRANIWDFGGQEIYHSTHQFFLTKRSLYLLVADTRREDTDFHYWLNAVGLLSDNSPLLIVKNEKQDRHRDINERQLRGQFDNLKETLATNLDTKRNLPQVLEQIQYYLSHLDHIGSPLPKTWVKVRAALEEDARNYISLDEYLAICSRHGFKEQKDKLQLSEYLHDLGVCLHFQTDPLLKKTVILKPKWGTDAVYKVLDNKTVINHQGKFNRSDLAVIWHEDKYANMQDELLQLMINFKLCYKLPDSDYYIAPQLLTENQPTYEWDESDNLLLRYTYPEFMPKGSLTRFIVITHKWIAEQHLVWRSGIILEKEHTRAEVIEHYGKREIRIRVSGRHKKELLTIVTYELDKIHESYKRLKYSKLIPCNCDKCKNSQGPYFYPFEDLQKFLGDRRETIECRNSYQAVNVRGLIDDVIDKKELLRETKEEHRSLNRYTINKVENLVIQQSTGGNNTMTQRNPTDVPIRSPWASGSFYLFVFAVVIGGLGVLARTIPFYVLPMVLIAGVILIPVIGALQLKQDERLSDKSFIELMKITFGQLPLIGRLGKPKTALPNNSKPKT